MKTKTLAQVLQQLKETLEDDQGWMDKYKSLEAIPEDGDELITEGRIEILEHVIEDLEGIEYEDIQKKSVASLTNYFNYAKKG